MRVTVLTTGGTIAEDEQGSVLGMSWERDRGPLPSIEYQPVEPTFKPVFALPSTDLTLSDILHLRNTIADELEAESCDGILVTHGTDTLEEVAFAVAASLCAHKPVAFTGAMRAPHELGSDAAVNVTSALLALAAARRMDRSLVMVVMDEVIHDATRARKGHSSSPSSFTSGDAGPIGFIHERQALFVNRATWPDLSSFQVAGHLPGELASVDLFTATAGGDPSVLSDLAGTESIGVVIDGTGGGHIPNSHAAGLRACIDAGKVIAVTTRCVEGLPLRARKVAKGIDADTEGMVRSPFNAVKTRMLLSVGAPLFGASGSLSEAVRELWDQQRGSDHA